MLFRSLMADCDLILVSGGLGPTNDDITKKTLADYFHCSLKINATALATIEKLLKPRYPVLPEVHKMQAMIPDKARVMKNTRGTASGMLFEEKGKTLVAMPGVPFELRGIFEDEVIPFLKKKTGNSILVCKNIKTIGIAESAIAGKIKDIEDGLPPNITLAYLPGIGQVKIRLTGKGSQKTVVEKQLNDVSGEIESRLEKYIYGYGDESIESAIGKLLEKGNARLAVAESCTGGYISHLLTTVPGCSGYLKGGIVAYSNDVKINELNVDRTLIEQQGAVSRACAEAMAKGILKKFNCTYSLATTGIAGPGGGTKEKPVGTVWLACAAKDGRVESFRFVMDRRRLQNIQYSAVNALNLLRKVILKSV